MLRLLSRSRKTPQGEGGGDEEHKKYKKANLGLANQLYYNDELKMWVERGKEQEAKAEKAKLSAPPPSVGSMSAASSATSLSTAADVTSGPTSGPVTFARDRSLKGRYLVTPGAPVAPATSGNGSSGPPSGKGLLPGGSSMVPGIPKIPGIPKPGAVPMIPPAGTFFMPTPAASEVASDAAGDSSTAGSMSVSQSGVSMEAFMPGSRSNSQPSLFVPGNTAGGSGSGGGEGQGSSAAAPMAVGAAGAGGVSAAGEDGHAAGLRVSERESSSGGKVPALSGGAGNLSFAMWQPTSPLKPQQHKQQQQQHGSAADGEPEVTSAEKQPPQQQQQHAEQQLPYVAANGNGNHAGYGYAPGSYGSSYGAEVAGDDAEGAPGAAYGTDTGMQGQQDYSSSAWTSQPAQDPFAVSAAGATAAAAAGEEGGTEGYNSSWQQPEQQPQGDGYSYPVEQPPQDPFGAFQDPFGVPQPGVAEGGLDMGAAAQSGWGEAGAWGDGTAAAAASTGPGAAAATGEADGGVPGAHAAAAGYGTDGYGQYAGWGQQGYGSTGHQGYGAYPMQQEQQGCEGANGVYQQPGQPEGYAAQQAAEGSDAVQQQQQQYATANGNYGYGYDGSSYGYFGYQQSDSAAAAAGLQQSADGAAAGATDSQQPYLEQQQQQMPVVLDPVHPELPGIATTATSVASDELGVSSSHKRRMLDSSTATAASGLAAARHQSAPGSAPHPAGFGSVGSCSAQGASFTMPLPARSNSLHSPGMGGGIGSLLPPARPSFNGRRGSIGSPPQKESSALTLPATAVAGDASMLTAVRPSSPYARPVSPLARTSTGMSDHSTTSIKNASQGFPIPSPPSGPFGRPGMFIPGAPSQQGLSTAGAPWRPSMAGVDAAAAAAGEAGSSAGYNLQQGSGGFGAQPVLLNGYTGGVTSPATHSASAGALGAAAGQGSMANGSYAPWGGSSQQQQHQNEHAGCSDAAATGLLDRRLSQPAGTFMPTVPGGAAPWPDLVDRAHPYESFIAGELRAVNWKAVHFKQPGRLNKLTPQEEFEMERELLKEQQQQQDGRASRRDAFWYRQMEHRQKLPAAVMKPSASEPTSMPSHIAAAHAAAAAAAADGPAAPFSPGDSSLSQASNYTDWQQQQQQHHRQQQYGQQQHAAGASSPSTPARAATAGAAFAVAGRSPGEEVTPTSKFVPLAEDVKGYTPGEHVHAAAAAEVQHYDGSYAAYGQQQQQQQQLQTAGAAAVGTDGYGQEAAATDGAIGWQPEQQTQDQQYGQYYGGYGEQQPGQADAQYYASQQYYEQYYQQQGYYQQPEAQQQDGQQQNLMEEQQQHQEQQQQHQEQHLHLPHQQHANEEQQQQQHQQQQQQQQQHLEGWGSEEQLATAEQDGHNVAAAAAASSAWDHAGAHQHVGDEAAAAKPGAAAMQQLDVQAAAAADAAADAWGADAGAFDALVLPEPTMGPEVTAAAAAEGYGAPEYFAPGAGDAEQQPTAADAAFGVVAVLDGQGPRTARLSSGTGSPPSTAKVAAAAAKHIVSQALDNIILEHAEGAAAAAAYASSVDGGTDGTGAEGIDATAAAAAGDGWEVDELAVGELAAAAEYVGGQVAGVEQQEEAAAAGDEAGAEGSYSMPAYPKDWLRLRERLAEAGGSFEGDTATYRDYFFQYGDYLFQFLGDSGEEHEQAAAVAAADGEAAGELEHVLELFGELQMKAEVSDNTFFNQELDIEAVLNSLAMQ